MQSWTFLVLVSLALANAARVFIPFRKLPPPPPQHVMLCHANIIDTCLIYCGCDSPRTITCQGLPKAEILRNHPGRFTPLPPDVFAVTNTLCASNCHCRTTWGEADVRAAQAQSRQLDDRTRQPPPRFAGLRPAGVW